MAADWLATAEDIVETFSATDGRQNSSSWEDRLPPLDCDQHSQEIARRNQNSSEPFTDRDLRFQFF